MVEEQEIRRVMWKCRRGTKELDLILGRFAQNHFAGLSAADRIAFRRLLDLEDPVLTDWLCYQVEPDVQGLEHIVRKILSADNG